MNASRNEWRKGFVRGVLVGIVLMYFFVAWLGHLTHA